MLILDDTTSSIEIDLNAAVATNQLPFVTTWVDHTSSTYTPGSTTGTSNNTTATTIVASPGASTQRSVKYISIKNNDTADVLLWVHYNDNATLRELVKITLSPQDTLEFIDTLGWSVINTSGQKKSLASISGTVAVTQSGTWDEVGINDSGNSITVDNAALSVVGGGTEAAAQRVTIANDSTGVLSVDDNGASLTVDGTVTANAGTNLNTSALAVESGGNLATIAALSKAEDAAHASGHTGIMALSVRQDTAAALAGTDADYQPLITDASGRLHVNVGNTVTVGSHAVTNAGTFATQSSQSGTWTVQPGNTANTTPWLASIHDGTTKASVADLTNANPLHVALVDSNGDQVSSFGGGTQYTEDAAAAANPVGTVPILVRKDTPASEVSADGDNVAQRGTTYGAAYVTLLDTGGSPVAVGGGTQYTEDAAAAANPIGTALIAVRDDARAGSLTSADGDNVALRATNAGEVYVKHVDAIPITDNAGSLTVDGSVTANAGTNLNTSALALESGGNLATLAGAVRAEDVASANAHTGIPLLATRKATPANVSDTDGDYEFLQMSVGRLWTSTTVDAALPAGTNNIGDVDVLTLPNVTLAAGTNTNEVVGDVAHDAAIAGNPISIGAVASAAAPTDVSADGDAVRVWARRNGSLVVNLASGGTLITGDGTNGLDVDVTRVTGTVSTAGEVAHDAADSGNPLKVGGVARTSDITAVANADRVNYIADTLGKQVVLIGSVPDLNRSGTLNRVNTTAADVIAAAGAGVRIAVMAVTVTNAHATVSTKVSIRDGTTVKITGYAAALGGGFSTNGGGVPLFISTANTAVTAICGTTGADVDINVSGYILAN